jgi:hypothetical protein
MALSRPESVCYELGQGSPQPEIEHAEITYHHPNDGQHSKALDAKSRHDFRHHNDADDEGYGDASRIPNYIVRYFHLPSATVGGPQQSGCLMFSNVVRSNRGGAEQQLVQLLSLRLCVGCWINPCEIKGEAAGGNVKLPGTHATPIQAEKPPGHHRSIAYSDKEAKH